MRMIYILRYSSHVFSHITGFMETGLIQHEKSLVKNLLFHHLEDVDNWIRNNVKASELNSLRLITLQVE